MLETLDYNFPIWFAKLLSQFAFPQRVCEKHQAAEPLGSQAVPRDRVERIGSV